jgi:hypothetical protein
MKRWGAGVFQTGSGQRRVSLITTNAGMSFHKRAFFSALSGRVRKGAGIEPIDESSKGKYVKA